MSLFDLCLLAAAGALAGTLNAIAGGGTFFTFAALVSTGLPPVLANATSAVGLAPANLASVAAYLPEVRRNYRRYAVLAGLGSLGGGLGALMLVLTPASAFKILVPYFLGLATLLFAFAPQIRLIGGRLRGDAGQPGSIARIIEALVSVYGGYFGAGMGVMMLASLSLSEPDDYHFINAAKNVWAAFVQLFSVTLFLLWGVTLWKSALIIMISSSLGGYYGVALARRIPPRWIRAFVIIAGTALTLRFFLI
eukprot:gene10088-10156_t